MAAYLSYSVDQITVGVTLFVDPAGKVVPQTIHWTDGRVFVVKRVLDVMEFPPSKEMGPLLRYTIRVGKHITYLYREEHDGRQLWFVRPRKMVRGASDTDT